MYNTRENEKKEEKRRGLYNFLMPISVLLLVDHTSDCERIKAENTFAAVSSSFVYNLYSSHLKMPPSLKHKQTKKTQQEAF